MFYIVSKELISKSTHPLTNKKPRVTGAFYVTFKKIFPADLCWFNALT